MWHTDYALLPDGRWFIAYMDNASRFITGHGVSARATGQNALRVLHGAAVRHGRPASILTNRGAQFYANGPECRKRGETEFGGGGLPGWGSGTYWPALTTRRPTASWRGSAAS